VETNGERSTSFSRQMTLQEATSLSHEVVVVARQIFRKYWRGWPVSHLQVSLTRLSDQEVVQVALFDDRIKAYQLERTADHIKDRYGSDALVRASSVLESGVARERAGQIGGHFK
jgi:hypothetical protein